MKKILKNVTLISLLMLTVFMGMSQTLVNGLDAVVTCYGDSPTTDVAGVKAIGDPLSSAVFNTNWTPTPTGPPPTTWTVANLGQVFGTCIDNSGNVYFATTAMYSQSYSNAFIMCDPTIVPSTAGGDGYNTAGGAAGIYKAQNSSLNTISVLTGTVNAASGGGFGTTTLPNNGYGVGNITYSSTHDKIYATNLEDGKIYKIDLPSGNVSDVFDPFSADIGTDNNVAPHGERLFGVAVNKERDGSIRLYYSVLMMSNVSNIYSVELDALGDMLGATNKLEINNITGLTFRTYISDIAFSVRGEMLLAEKGAAHDARVFQYHGQSGAWSVPDDFGVGSHNNQRNSAGGVDYASVQFNGQVYCDSLIWVMANAMKTPTWYYGLQSIPYTDYLVPLGGTNLPEAYIVDINPIGQFKGGFGDVEFFETECQSIAGDICDEVEVFTEAMLGDSCCHDIYVTNNFNGQYFTSVIVESSSLSISSASSGSWGNWTYQSATSIRIDGTVGSPYLPLGTTNVLRTCFSGSGNDVLSIKLIGTAPQYDTVCIEQVEIGCDPTPPIDTTCVAVVQQEMICDAMGQYNLQFSISNQSNFIMRGITIVSLNPNVTATPWFVPIADLPPGMISPTYSVPLVVAGSPTNACFFYAGCDINVAPGTSGEFPQHCCMDSIPYCVELPACDPCDGLVIDSRPEDDNLCCYSLDLTNNYINDTIHCVEFCGVGGTQFSVFSGWNILAPVTSSYIKICAPGGYISTGYYPNFARFCLTGTSVSPHQILVKYLNGNDEVFCTDTLLFENCELADPTCANIINDSLFCDGNEIKYSFYVENNSPFDICHFDIHPSDTNVIVTPGFFEPSPCIPTGTSAGPFEVIIDTLQVQSDFICLYLTGHNNIYIPDSIFATRCCTDSLGVICLPLIACDSTILCCSIDNLIIPTGITPNEDGYNDQYVFLNTEHCDEINIQVFNRWGNIVYEDKDYTNDWKGTNEDGDRLPQGTYFVLIKTADGNKKGLYLDLRY